MRIEQPLHGPVLAVGSMEGRKHDLVLAVAPRACRVAPVAQRSTGFDDRRPGPVGLAVREDIPGGAGVPEQGRREPEGPAKALLKVVEKEPQAVLKALHP